MLSSNLNPFASCSYTLMMTWGGGHPDRTEHIHIVYLIETAAEETKSECNWGKLSYSHLHSGIIEKNIFCHYTKSLRTFSFRPTRCHVNIRPNMNGRNSGLHITNREWAKTDVGKYANNWWWCGCEGFVLHGILYTMFIFNFLFFFSIFSSISQQFLYYFNNNHNKWKSFKLKLK